MLICFLFDKKKPRKNILYSQKFSMNPKLDLFVFHEVGMYFQSTKSWFPVQQPKNLIMNLSLELE